MRAVTTEDEIVSTALALVESDGIDKLTMRRLATELGITPMSIYWHIPNKEALLDRLCDRVIADVTVPDVWSGTWDERVFLLARDTWVALSAHPGLAAVALERLPTSLSPNSLRLLDASASLLREAGYDAPDAARAALTAYLFVAGHVQFEGARAVTEGASDGREGDEHPWLATLASSASLDALELFEYGFRRLLDGFQAELALLRPPSR